MTTANKKIYEYSQNLPRRGVMGTTVSLAVVRNNKLYTAHAGDSRIYRMRIEKLEKLTKDHSMVQQLVDMGQIKEEEADSHKLSNVVTKALGSADSLEPDISVFDIERGDRILLSTDGLFRVLNIDSVKDVLSGSLSVEEKCKTLVDKTLEGGAPDNVSVIILETDKKISA